MTSELKCPFCGTRMTKIAGELYDSFGCQNDECHYKYGWISEAVWQALIQAKQDLEIARDAITDVFGYVKEHEKDIGGCAVNIVIKLGLALTQITHDNSEKANSVEHKE